MGWLLFVLGILVVALLVLNWRLAWRRNETEMKRGPQRWQGWDGGG